jgi:hypothetical protein
VESDVADRWITDGSFYFDNQPNMLDQFMVNKNMAPDDAPIKADLATVQILKPPAMTSTGVYPKPILSAEWEIRESERVLRPLPNHHDRHRTRLGHLRLALWPIRNAVITAYWLRE